MVITIVAGYAFLKFLVRKMRDQFRKHEAAGIHPSIVYLGRRPLPEGSFSIFDSSRSRPKFTLRYSWERTCAFSKSTLPDTSGILRTADSQLPL